MAADNKKVFVTRSSLAPYEEVMEALKPLWKSRWLTNMGQYHNELERRLKEYLEVPQLSLLVNGHMALEMVLQAMNFPMGSEVITTPFTFISTTHAIIRSGLQPVFCDVKSSDGTIDETKIEKLVTENTVAILPVHVYGNVCDVDKIQTIADKFGLKVIYDACHAFGVKYKGVGIGNYGDASVFSFHATKVFNTIEGGAVAFSDAGLYKKLYDLKNFGIHGPDLVTAVGANAKMNEVCAIMGLCNLRHLSEAMESRRTCDGLYRDMLKERTGIRLLNTVQETDRNFAYIPIIVEENYPLTRDELAEKLADNNIYARKYFYPITSDQACFKNKYRNIELPVARDLSNRVLTLPLYEGLEQEIVQNICELI